MFIVGIFLSSPLTFAEYKLVKVTSLNLNRHAYTLNQPELPNLSHAGFRWNNGDNKTTAWRPQGIAGVVSGGCKFLAVSWYHLDEYKGVRLSIADVTDMTNVNYRHVLLVDKNQNTLDDLHAGGLVYRKGNFHVPDSRNSSSYKVLTFSINNIKEVPVEDRAKFHNYRYIIEQSSSYSVNRKPSFMSYDWTRDQVLFGSYFNCIGEAAHSDSAECLKQSPSKHQIAYYDIDNAQNEFDAIPLFTEMQGAASDNGRIWVSCSFGRNYPSHMHFGQSTVGLNTDYAIDHFNDFYSTYIYPPGLEDIHVSLSSNNLWTLTEFGPNEGNNNRIVFATNRDLF